VYVCVRARESDLCPIVSSQSPPAVSNVCCQ
jgi:hypothetical protein